MPMGLLTEKMKQAIAFAVGGKHAFDFGAGDRVRTSELIQFGAKHVTSIEKEGCSYPPKTYKSPKNTFFHGSLIEYPVPEHIDVACLFWPINSSQMDSVLLFLEVSDIIIYLGRHDAHTACGSKLLWAYLSTREVITVIEHYRNDLIIYVNKPRDNQPIPREELRALDQWSL